MLLLMLLLYSCGCNMFSLKTNLLTFYKVATWAVRSQLTTQTCKLVMFHLLWHIQLSPLQFYTNKILPTLYLVRYLICLVTHDTFCFSDLIFWYSDWLLHSPPLTTSTLRSMLSRLISSQCFSTSKVQMQCLVVIKNKCMRRSALLHVSLPDAVGLLNWGQR